MLVEDPLCVQVDVRNPEQVDEMVQRVLRHFGRIDILVNNAAGNFVCRAEDLSPNGWNAVIGIVLNGSFYCSRAIGRCLIDRGQGGAIVSVLANYIWTGSPGTVHSAAAKAGVMSMTQTLAVEWARHKIRVNAVAPGPIESAGAAIAIMCAGNAIGACVTGGFAVNHMDVAPRHAGTLMGITNTAGTIPGIIGVYVSGLILQATGSWALVFQVAAGVTLFGLVFYLIFGSGKKVFD